MSVQEIPYINSDKEDKKDSEKRQYSALFSEGCRHLFGAVDEDDKVSACNSFLEGAKIGDGDCTYYLGMCLEYGFGCDVDLESAYNMYKLAADMDYPDAINNLGGCYFYGHGTKKDLNAAFCHFKRASELGNIKATCRVGICYQYGYGTNKDTSKAIEYYNKAAENGSDIACMILADIYDKGEIVPYNINEAFRYYEMAANAGNISAMLELGDRLMSNKISAMRASDAYYWYDLAARHGSVTAKFRVANCNYEGIGKIRNYREAFKIYKALSEQEENREVAYFRLGMCYLKGLGVSPDRSLAFEYIKKSVTSGMPEALFALGECYYFGIGTNKDLTLAAENYTLSANSGCSAAYVALGELYENGLGVDPDDAYAIKMFKKAADLDNIEGVYNLGRCIKYGIGQGAGFYNSRMFALRAAKKKHIASSLLYAKDLEESGDIESAIMWYKNCVSFDIKATECEYVSNDRKNILLRRDTDAKTEAKYHLAMLKLSLNRLPRNCAESLDYIADAAACGLEDAIVQISRIYSQFGDFKINQSFNAESSADNSDTDNTDTAMYKLGNAFFSGSPFGVSKNITLAVKCYKYAAESGNISAMYCYGWCLRHGKGVKEDNKVAALWLKRAADAGNANAMYSYGLCCEEGSATGIKNKREALTYYRKAAVAGHEDAAKRYNRMIK